MATGKNLLKRWIMRPENRGQGMVEFALILPLLLLLIFVIIELGRLFFAWMAIENAARFGARYAVTGEFDDSFCPFGVCSDPTEEQVARLQSIDAAAGAGSAGIQRDLGVSDPAVAGFYNVVVCPPEDLQAPASYFDTFSCTGGEKVSEPGEEVAVVVEYNHKLIVPILSSWWPELRLNVKRESVVESFRLNEPNEAPVGGTLPEPQEPPPPPVPGPIPCSDPRIQNALSQFKILNLYGSDTTCKWGNAGCTAETYRIGKLRSSWENRDITYDAWVKSFSLTWPAHLYVNDYPDFYFEHVDLYYTGLDVDATWTKSEGRKSPLSASLPNAYLANEYFISHDTAPGVGGPYSGADWYATEKRISPDINNDGVLDFTGVIEITLRYYIPGEGFSEYCKVSRARTVTFPSGGGGSTYPTPGPSPSPPPEGPGGSKPTPPPD